MRKPPALLLAVGAVLLAPAGAAAQDDAAKKIVEQAVQAHGGAEALAKTRLMVQTYRGEITNLGSTIPASCEETMQLPERDRCSYTLEAGAQKVLVQLGINGDKGWRSSGGAAKEMARAEWDEQRDRAYAAWLMTVLPLQKEVFELKVLPEIKVGDAPAVGVEVKRKDRPDVKLYFDKKTNLLVKVERRAKDAGQEVNVEYVLSEPKTFDGVKLATKRLELANGKKAAEWTLERCKFPEKVDENTFAKP